MRLLIVFSMVLLTGGTLTGMTLEVATATNAPITFEESYKVGMVLFENRTGDTNLDFLQLSLPLMIKEGVKKNIDYFIPPEELLVKNKKKALEHTDRTLRYRVFGDAPKSLQPDGAFFQRKRGTAELDEARKKASLRKSLDFSAQVIRKNQNSFGEIAAKEKLHYLLYGDYQRVTGNRVRVRVYLFSSISGKTVHRAHYDFEDGKVLLELDRLIARFRDDLIRFPTVGLRIVTEPPGALVYFGKSYMGTTPLALPFVPATNHRVFLRKTDYAPLKLDIALRPGKRYLLKRSLVHTGGSGFVEILSEPAGAEVRIDLILRGKTPLILSNFPAGEYRISLDKEKYHRRYSQLLVAKGKSTRIKIGLQPQVKGELTIDQRVKRHKKWMNVFFWSGGGSLVSYAFFYFKREDYTHQYQQAISGGNNAAAASAWNSRKNYSIASDISLGVTAGCFALSAYFLIRYMLADDRQLGQAPVEDSLPGVFATSGPGSLSLNWRF